MIACVIVTLLGGSTDGVSVIVTLLGAAVILYAAMMGLGGSSNGVSRVVTLLGESRSDVCYCIAA